MMAMLGMMACYKLSMMGPMLMMLIGLKALKALLMATVALTISKLMLLKKLKGGGKSWNKIYVIYLVYPAKMRLRSPFIPAV